MVESKRPGTPCSLVRHSRSIEQLRALALGRRIHVTVLDGAPPADVDTPEDLERVRALFVERRRSVSSCRVCRLYESE